MLIMNSMHLINLHFRAYCICLLQAICRILVRFTLNIKFYPVLTRIIQNIDSTQGFNLDLLFQSQVCLPCGSLV